jgi:murein DD-endopeptidase MepM/ murein hydrolase activator NlpD
MAPFIGTLLVLAIWLVGFFPSTASLIPPAKERGLAVRVTTKREGAVTHFFVENDELCEITMSFELGLRNLKPNAGAALTATFPPQATTEAFALEPRNEDAPWEYSYTNYFKLGSSVAIHDDNHVYQLPYAAGSKYKVTQAYAGKFSHTGSNRYAIDWQMPEGTPVLAARGGVVVKVKDDSTTGGPNIKFDPFNNYVLIRHDDGTLGHYCHLQRGGVCVKPGQIVSVGERIARSGNTGFSSGPHLHFAVFKTKDGKERISLPIKFRTDDDRAATLVEGRRYTAAPVQTASSPAPIAAGSGNL